MTGIIWRTHENGGKTELPIFLPQIGMYYQSNEKDSTGKYKGKGLPLDWNNVVKNKATSVYHTTILEERVALALSLGLKTRDQMAFHFQSERFGKVKWAWESNKKYQFNFLELHPMPNGGGSVSYAMGQNHTFEMYGSDINKLRLLLEASQKARGKTGRGLHWNDAHFPIFSMKTEKASNGNGKTLLVNTDHGVGHLPLQTHSHILDKMINVQGCTAKKPKTCEALRLEIDEIIYGPVATHPQQVVIDRQQRGNSVPDDSLGGELNAPLQVAPLQPAYTAPVATTTTQAAPITQTIATTPDYTDQTKYYPTDKEGYYYDLVNGGEVFAGGSAVSASTAIIDYTDPTKYFPVEGKPNTYYDLMNGGVEVVAG